MENERKHTIEAVNYSLAKMLERASYYGLRSILVLYMLEETFTFETSEALAIYSFFTGSLVVSQVLGAIFGDLLIGNKKAMIAGGIMQAFGAFCLTDPSTTGLYTGLFFVVMGGGFYTPNIFSNYGKVYVDKPKIMDAGFMIFYLGINVGVLLGVLLIAYSSQEYGYTMSFAICGFLSILSLAPILHLKEKIVPEKTKAAIGNGVVPILIACAIAGSFWGVFEITGYHLHTLQTAFSEMAILDIPASTWHSLPTILLLPVGLILIVVWTRFYFSQFFKLLIGAIFGAAAFGILLLIPEMPGENHGIYYLLSLLFLAIAEAHIGLIICPILTKYSNPKYLAIVFSLYLAANKFFVMAFANLNNSFHTGQLSETTVAMMIMILVCLGIIAYLILSEESLFLAEESPLDSQ